jgi:hypothetical protein
MPPFLVFTHLALVLQHRARACGVRLGKASKKSGPIRVAGPQGRVRAAPRRVLAVAGRGLAEDLEGWDGLDAACPGGPFRMWRLGSALLGQKIQYHPGIPPGRLIVLTIIMNKHSYYE